MGVLGQGLHPGQVYPDVHLPLGGADAVSGDHVGIQGAIGIVRHPGGGAAVGLVKLGDVLAVLPLVVDAKAELLDPLTGGQGGGHGCALGGDLHGAPDVVDAAVGQVKLIGGGHQLHGTGVLHGGHGAELAGEGGLRRGHGIAVLGGGDGHGHPVARLEGLELFDGVFQGGAQGGRRGVGGGIEAAVGGVIGLLGGGVVLQSVGGRVVGRHPLCQVQQILAVALVGIGGEPDGRQSLGRGVQGIAVAVVVQGIVVRPAVHGGDEPAVDAGEGVAAVFQHVLHRVAVMIADILRLDDIAVLGHGQQGDAPVVCRIGRNRQQRQQHQARQQRGHQAFGNSHVMFPPLFFLYSKHLAGDKS